MIQERTIKGMGIFALNPSTKLVRFSCHLGFHFQQHALFCWFLFSYQPLSVGDVKVFFWVLLPAFCHKGNWLSRGKCSFELISLEAWSMVSWSHCFRDEVTRHGGSVWGRQTTHPWLGHTKKSSRSSFHSTLLEHIPGDLKNYQSLIPESPSDLPLVQHESQTCNAQRHLRFKWQSLFTSLSRDSSCYRSCGKLFHQIVNADSGF